MDLQGIQNAYDAGADLVVIGTAFENNIHFLIRIRNNKYK
jgi:putative glycerol-1-phosphate prenyltransferase